MNPLRIVSDYILLLIFFLFFGSAFIANWTLNPIHNLFFARLTGFLFYNLHASSLMAVSLVGLYFLIRTRLRDISRTVLGIAGLGAIHEFVWGIFYGSLFLPSNIRYYSAFGIFLVLAITFCRKNQTEASWFSTWFIIVFELSGHALGIPLTQLDLFTPTEYFNDLIPNAFEVLSWILISVVYLLVCIYYSPNGKNPDSIGEQIPSDPKSKRIPDSITVDVEREPNGNDRNFPVPIQKDSRFAEPNPDEESQKVDAQSEGVLRIIQRKFSELKARIMDSKIASIEENFQESITR